ncbi:hypothetical protein BD626DRAFT_504919, partial [Schizophyllum amplum]
AIVSNSTPNRSSALRPTVVGTPNRTTCSAHPATDETCPAPDETSSKVFCICSDACSTLHT